MYTITKEGELFENISEYKTTFYTREEIKNLKLKPWEYVKERELVKQVTEKVDYHGTIRFYSNFKLNEEEEIWLDFEAYFIYGKVDKLVLANTEKWKSNNVDVFNLIKEHDELKNTIGYKIKKYSGWLAFWKQASKVFSRASHFFSGLSSFAIRRLMLFFVFCAGTSTCLAETPIKFTGNIDYTKQSSESLSSSNTINFKHKLHEHQSFSLYLSNAVTVDLDCFNKQIKESLVFTTICVEF
jgi:hypothetical protein